MQQKHPKNYQVLRSSLTRCERHHYLFTMKRCSEKVCAICNISSDDRIPIVFFYSLRKCLLPVPDDGDKADHYTSFEQVEFLQVIFEFK